MSNPYQSPRIGSLVKPQWGPHARLVHAAFLYRVIEFDQPFVGQLRYSSWWWRQRVELNGQTVWFRISWLRIHPKIEFQVPPTLLPESPTASIDIDFSRQLHIRRFRLVIGEEVVYDENHGG